MIGRLIVFVEQDLANVLVHLPSLFEWICLHFGVRLDINLGVVQVDLHYSALFAAFVLLLSTSTICVIRLVAAFRLNVVCILRAHRQSLEFTCLRFERFLNAVPLCVRILLLLGDMLFFDVTSNIELLLHWHGKGVSELSEEVLDEAEAVYPLLVVHLNPRCANT